jgi:5'-phosphate synthase pdxT subunit
VLPGGESTTLSLLLGSSGLFDELAAALAGGLPTLATCAGLVLLASELVDGRSDQRSFGALACTVRRNGYGRQRSSFEAELAVPKVSAELGVEDRPLPAVFIRAPQVVALGEGVEVLATVAGAEGQPATPALVRQGPLLAAAFHPELTSDRRLHQLFAQMIGR